ncbi:MAG: hypothetical protein CR997_08995 [Acidobacteria bacterium]|nr:MAG: hypothetical protein CR997_08995 [Acidobacteriota bacterium]
MKHCKEPPFYLVLTGLVLATCLALGFQLKDGNLLVSGRVVAQNMSVSRMLSALLSLSGPFIVFIPFYSMAGKVPFRQALIRASLAPWLLLMPSICVLVLKGEGLQGATIAVLFLMSAFISTLTMWLLLLHKRFKWPTLYLTWACLWMSTEFLAYLQNYLAPYLDSLLIKAIGYLYWLCPPINFVQSTLEPVLNNSSLPWTETVKLVGHILFLVTVLLFFRKKTTAENSSSHNH